MQTISFDFYATFVLMALVLLLGGFIIRRVHFLRFYNIPEAVVGGLIAASVFLIIRLVGDVEFKFDGGLKDPLMLAFFTSIGLMADFGSLKKGGKRLFVFLAVICVMLIIQNVAGISVAKLMGQDGLLGLLSGSITMSGGHGTGAAWAVEFSKAPYNFSGAMEVAMASATFGLVVGGIIGGPVAAYLIKKHALVSTQEKPTASVDSATSFEQADMERRITQNTFIESVSLIAICLFVGSGLAVWVKSFELSWTLPTFVYCLFCGVILRNVLGALNIHEVFDREVAMIGNVSLALFLAFSLMSINLLQLASLAVPILVILLVQSVIMIFYAIFVTFKFCGKDYDAAVLAAGHCGFGLGATPTAMVNMQAVCKNYGMSAIAFIIVPLCGAFFIDIVNAVVIQGFVALLGY